MVRAGAMHLFDTLMRHAGRNRSLPAAKLVKKAAHLADAFLLGSNDVIQNGL